MRTAWFLAALLQSGGAWACPYGSDRCAVGDVDHLDVLSFNVWGLPPPLAPDRAGRLARVAGWMTELAPDVVAFQELWTGAVPMFDLPVHRSALSGDSGLAVHTRHVVQEVEALRFSRARGFDALKQKGALRGRLVRAEGPDVWLVVTHLQAGHGRGNAAVREAQVRELLAWIDEIDGPVLVVGDFNMDRQDVEDLPALRTLADAGLTDTAEQLDVLDATYPDGRRYDRIFARDGGGWRVVAEVAEVMPHGPTTLRLSDHRPLRTRLRLERLADASADVWGGTR